MIGTYRKKPVEVSAIQVHFRDNEIVSAVMKWAGRAVFFGGYDPEENHFANASIKTREGTMMVREDDWIIQGVKGEFYPCKPDIFEAAYEKVSE